MSDFNCKVALATMSLAVVPAAAVAQQATTIQNQVAISQNQMDADSDETVAADAGSEQIIIAAKRPVTLGESTQSTSVILNEVVVNQAQTDLSDVLRLTPGIQFQEAGAPGQFNYPRLRGFSDSTLYTLDGMTLNGGGSGAINNLLGQLDPTMFDSIEVLRGPRATLYGANTTSGVIALTTKIGTQYESDASLEGGSLDWKKARLGTENDLDVLGGTLHYSVDFSKVHSAGVWQYEFFDSSSLSGRVFYDIGSFEFGFSSYDTENAFQNADLVEVGPGVTKQTYFAAQIPDPHNENKQTLYVGTAWIQEKITDELTQKVMVGYAGQWYALENGDTANGGLIGTYTAPYDNWADPNSGVVYNAGQTVPVYQFLQSYVTNEINRQAEYNLVYDNGRISSVTGATYLTQSFVQDGSYGATTQRQDDVSGFINAGIGFFDDTLHTEGGARVDSYSAWGSHATYSVGANYMLPLGVTTYANYGTSYTAPTLTQLYDPTYGSIALTPANANTLEGGLRFNEFTGVLTGSVTLWKSYVNNVITYDYNIPNKRVTTGFGQYANENAERSNGVEAEVAFRITPELTANANWTLTDAGMENAGVWAPMIESAHNMGNVGLTYTVARFTVNANVMLMGQRLRWAGDVYAPGYARLDLSGRFHLTDRIDLYGRIKDATNHDIIETLGYRNPRFYGIAGIGVRF